MNDASDEIREHVSKPSADDWAHLGPSRWWFASAAFPMIAGTLGPVASAFSICALVKPWRQSYPPGTNIDSAPFIGDPPWLTVINAVQLVIALIANMALLLNMTRRLSFSVAQPVTIVGWYVSAFALIALTATASGPLVIEPADEFVWSQAFYYGVYSAVLYFLVASLMLATYLGAHAGRYPKDFMLTPSQRTLMLQTIMLLVYLLLGALVFSNIEGWTYLDAVYWAAVTLLTVGFGDFYASTTLGRSLLIPYALVGIISLGLVIGSIRSLVLDRGKRRLGARMVEKKRRNTLRRMARLGKDDILVPVTDDPVALSSVRTDSSGLTEFERREREFQLMRKIQDVAARRRRWVALAMSTSTWLTLWLVGAKIFQECEERYQGWSYFDGFYFAFVSLTTVGYGDLTPVSNAGKSFWVLWALLAVPTTTVLISNAGDTVIKGVRDATDQIATVTILPSERGFKRDMKRLLRMLSCGILFQEDVREEPAGLLGQPERFKDAATNNPQDEDAEEAMQQDEADLYAEADGARNADAARKRNRGIDLESQTSRAEADRSDERTTPQRRITFSESPAPSKSTPRAASRRLQRQPSLPRQNLPVSPPASKDEYLVTLADEIGRVSQHLKRHPPRKYTFHEWAWYLALIGEDESDAGRHRRPHGHAHAGKPRHEHAESEHNPLVVAARGGKRKAGRGRGSKDHKGSPIDSDGAASTSAITATTLSPGGGNDGQTDGGEGPDRERDSHSHSHKHKHNHNHNGDSNGDEEDKEGKTEDEPLPWSWVGDRSPLMGSQEEAEWILERLIARLADELKAARDKGREEPSPG